MSLHHLGLPGGDGLIELSHLTVIPGLEPEEVRRVVECFDRGSVVLEEVEPEPGADVVSCLGDLRVAPPMVRGAQLWASPFDGEDADGSERGLRALLEAAVRTERGLRDWVETAEVEQQQTVETRAEVAAAIERARTRLDPHAAVALDRARRAIDGDPAPSRGGEASDPVDEPTTSTEQETAATEVHDLADFERTTVAPVEEAVAAFELARSVVEGEPVTSVAAQRVANEIEQLDAQLAEYDAQLAAVDQNPVELSEQVQMARRRLKELRTAARPATAPEADIAELEEAHERVLEAEAKVAGRFRGGKALKQLEAATENEQSILDRLGFATWSAYIMRTTLFGADDVTPEAIEQAEAELGRTEAELEEMVEKIENDPDRHTLVSKREEAGERAIELVGDVEDPVAALRALRVNPTEVSSDLVSAAELLRLSLIRARVITAEVTIGHEAVFAAAESWLAEIHSIRSERQRLEQHDERPPVAEPVDTVAEPVDTVVAESDTEDAAPENHTDTESAAARDEATGPMKRDLADAEERVAQHRHSVRRIASLREEAEALAVKESELANELATHRQRFHEARHGRIHLAAQLAGLLVRMGADDPMTPLADSGDDDVVIIIEPLDEAEVEAADVFAALDALATIAQVVIVSGDPVVLDWAEGTEVSVASPVMA